MASLHSFHKILHRDFDTLLSSSPKTLKESKQDPAISSSFRLPISRRNALLMSVLPLNLVADSPPSLARERRSRRNIPIEEYSTSSDGLKYYDLTEGKGPVAAKGSTVQPYEFVVGSPPGKERKRDSVDNANGLYSAQAAPKPPPAMYSVTEGMKVGGKRTVIVPPEVGYGKKGMNEIPPEATFELNIELLQVASPTPK